MSHPEQAVKGRTYCLVFLTLFLWTLFFPINAAVPSEDSKSYSLGGFICIPSQTPPYFFRLDFGWLGS